MNAFHHIIERIHHYEQLYHRRTGSVVLVAVTKNRSIEDIDMLYKQGQRHFGESYLQEALPKIAALHYQHIEWHFIGPMQSNKTRKIAEHFSWVHSVDNTRHAERLHEQRPPSLPPLQICLQVNISEEEKKSGVAPSELLALATHCQSLSRLQLRGLMCIPKPTSDIAKQRATYHQMMLLKNHLSEQGITLDTLSMGMSHDFESAIAEGATMIRIGTALFLK